MGEQVTRAPGWAWVPVGVELFDEDDPEPGGREVFVPSRLRVLRTDDDGRPVLRVDVVVTPRAGGGWEHGVTGLEVFGDADHLVAWSTLRSLGLDGAVEDVVRAQMRVQTPAAVEGDGFAADVRAIDEATYEAVDPDNAGIVAARRAARPAGPAVSRRERRAGIDEQVERAAAIYREEVARHEGERDAGKVRPVDAVVHRLGLTRRTAARRVEQARAAGLLPPTSQGKVTS